MTSACIASTLDHLKMRKTRALAKIRFSFSFIALLLFLFRFVFSSGKSNISFSHISCVPVGENDVVVVDRVAVDYVELSAVKENAC